jgi:hypothetical protein
MSLNGATFSVSANINLQGPTNQERIYLVGTMSGDITLTLPTTPDVQYWIDTTGIATAGGGQPHAILLTTGVGGTTNRTMATSSNLGLWPVYVDAGANVRFTNPIV